MNFPPQGGGSGSGGGGGGGSGAGTSIATTLGRLLDLDADSGTYSDTACSVAQSSNNGNVKGWVSGDAYAVQATEATNPPTLLVSAVNGHNALSFNGTNQVLATPHDFGGGPTTIFMVAARTNWATVATVAGVSPYNSGAGIATVNGGGLFLCLGTAYDYLDGDMGMFGAGASNLSIPRAIGPPGLTGSGFHVVTGVAGPRAQLRVDGTSKATRVAKGAAIPTVGYDTGLTIGADVGGGYFLAGKVARVIVFAGRALELSEIQAIERELGTRYSITVA